MVDFERYEQDLIEDGADSTATHHRFDQQDYMYVWKGIGTSPSVIRFDVVTGDQTVVDSNPPVPFNNGKVIKPDPDPESTRCIAVPRYANNENRTYADNELVVMDVSYDSISYSSGHTYPKQSYHNPVAVADDGDVVWWGGKDDRGDGSMNKSMYRVSPSGSSSKVGELGTGIFQSAVGTLDGTVYQFGGQLVDDQIIDDVYEVDLTTASYTHISDLDTPIWGHFGRFYGGNYYSFGGSTPDNQNVPEVWNIDPETGTMDVLGEMDTGKIDIMTGSDDRQLWGFGGTEGSTEIYRIIRVRDDDVILASESLGTRGVFETADDEALLWNVEVGRGEFGMEPGDDVLLLSESFGQGS